MGWPCGACGGGEKRNSYRGLVGKPLGKRPSGKHRHRWKGDNKMDIKNIGWEVLEWIDLTQDRHRWWLC
jgi:hypothetical protein